jgi:hypothetical protein
MDSLDRKHVGHAGRGYKLLGGLEVVSHAYVIVWIGNVFAFVLLKKLMNANTLSQKSFACQI